MSHTPGPWELQDPMGDEELWVVEQGRQPYDWRCIATVAIVGGEIGDITPTEGNANARLIAAAPDLLAALEAHLEYRNSGLGGSSSKKAQEMRARRWDLTEAALAKAKGVA